MVSVLDKVLHAARQLGASDVHLKVGLPPIFRVKGDLRTVANVPPLTREAVEEFGYSMMNTRLRESYDKNWDVDLAYSSQDGFRYRVNVLQQRGMMGVVLRLIPPNVPPFERLNLPRKVLDLADEERGLVLVTGITGSGKSTTLAAMVDYINSTKAVHIVTIEDPIEYAFTDRRSVINQREVGFDTLSFSRALRSSLRQDPDVIMVGEMRDLETTEIALTAAETGHLVLSTLHTVDAVETINRIVSLYPPHQQSQARLQLCVVLKGVISQRLVTRVDGMGMVPAVEILINTPRVKELVADAKRTREVHEAIASGRDPYGMISFDQSLTDLVKNHYVTYEEALANATNPEDFALFFRGISKGGSTTAQDFARTGMTPRPTTIENQASFQVDRFKNE